MKDRIADDPTVAYWYQFLERFDKIPVKYQLMILDEYDEAENFRRDLDVDKMWEILIVGESKRKSFS